MGKFGANLKKLRESRGLTQRELATRLNVSPSTIALYELEKRSPDPEMLQRLAHFFNVPVDYLLGMKSVDRYAWLNKLPPHLREALEKDIDKYTPYFRILDRAILSDLDPLTLEQVANAIIDGKRRDEEARLRAQREKEAKDGREG